MVTLSMDTPTSVLSSATAGTTAATSLSSEYDAATSVGAVVFVETTLTFGAATLGGELRVYYSQDQTWSGNEKIGWIVDLPLTASASAQYPAEIPVKGRYMKFSVYNKDTAITITSIGITVQKQTVS